MKRIVLISTLLLIFILTAGTASAQIILQFGWPIIAPPVIEAPPPAYYPDTYYSYPNTYGYYSYPYTYGNYSYPYGYYGYRGAGYWGYGGRGYYGYRGAGYWGHGGGGY